MRNTTRQYWSRHFDARLAIALVCACAVTPVMAQQIMTQQITAQDESGSSHPAPLAAGELRGPLPDAAPNGENNALSVEDLAIIRNALTFDPSRDAARPAKSLKQPSLVQSNKLDVARTDRADGGANVAVKKPLHTEWDTKVGVDLSLAAPAQDDRPGQNPLPITRDGRGSGAAWASLSVPDIATVDARVDPTKDTGRLGTKFSRSLPVGRQFAVTFESGYSVTGTYGTPQAAVPDVLLMAAPVGTPGAPVPHIFGNDNAAKFKILPSGTTLAAGLSTTSIDPVTHNSLSAEQKIYGPLSVTTAVNDLGQSGQSKSIRAGLKLNW
ncbi:MAG TPA: hypothetical protein VFC54_14640 [Pseudolabrys sp.]|nr:hypothetical protein [Pseudolabrys sp.]